MKKRIMKKMAKCVRQSISFKLVLGVDEYGWLEEDWTTPVIVTGHRAKTLWQWAMALGYEGYFPDAPKFNPHRKYYFSEKGGDGFVTWICPCRVGGHPYWMKEVK